MDKNKERIDALKKRKDLYKTCFNTPAGEDIIAELGRICYVKYSTFSKDPQEMAFREGMRAVYLHIQAMIAE